MVLVFVGIVTGGLAFTLGGVGLALVGLVVAVVESFRG